MHHKRQHSHISRACSHRRSEGAVLMPALYAHIGAVVKQIRDGLAPVCVAGCLQRYMYWSSSALTSTP